MIFIREMALNLYFLGSSVRYVLNSILNGFIQTHQIKVGDRANF